MTLITVPPAKSDVNNKTLRSIDDLRALLRGVKKSADGFTAFCPAHDDGRSHNYKSGQSLQISEKSGWLHVYCHAGCTKEAILSALHLDAADLNITSRKAKSKAQKTIAKTYDYPGADGKLLFQAVRYEPKGFAQRRPDGLGKWVWNMDGVTPVLYHLPELLAEIKAGKQIWIVEGEKDADNARALGLAATTSPMGAGKWRTEYTETLKGAASVIVVADKDVPGRRHACDIAIALYSQGTPVKVVEVPGTGKDFTDWTNEKGDIDELIKAVENTVPFSPESAGEAAKAAPDDRYRMDWFRRCITYDQVTRSGNTETVILADFVARIKAVINRDDGARTTRLFLVNGIDRDGKALPEVEIPVEQFSSMSWVMKHWDVRAVIEPGPVAKDRVCKAIVMNSFQADRLLIYEHTGWRHIDGQDIYLSPSGAIGCEGVRVELNDALKRYDIPIPTPGADVLPAVEASVDFIGIGDYRVTLPLWACMYLAPLNAAVDTNFTLWLVGLSGCGKSRTAGLALSHFGDFDHLHLPAAWCDTKNKLEQMAFWTKDMPLVIDDFSPRQDWMQQKDMEQKADYICRNQGNRQGRGRMNTINYVPRGLLIATGEQTPKGQSNQARHFVITMKGEDVSKDALSKAQESKNLYRHAMGHYLSWLQKQWPELKPALRRRQRELRDEVYKMRSFESAHDRLPDIVSLLLLGLETGLKFAVEVGAIKQEVADIYNFEARQDFISLALEQAERVNVERPGLKFIEGLQTLADMGNICFGDRNDANPLPANPHLPMIGWEDRQNGHVLLNPDAAHQAVKQFWDKSGSPLTQRDTAIWADMKALGMIDCDEGRTNRVVRIYGSPRRVISLDKRYVNIIRKHGDAGGG